MNKDKRGIVNQFSRDNRTIFTMIKLPKMFPMTRPYRDRRLDAPRFSQDWNDQLCMLGGMICEFVGAGDSDALDGQFFETRGAGSDAPGRTMTEVVL
jgi:hypothetical protein